jgi:hypothetical protein
MVSLGSLRGFFSDVGEVAKIAAPVAMAGAALTTGGTAATLGRIGTGASILAGTQQGQSTAVERQVNGMAQETAMSGEMGALYSPGGRFVGYDTGSPYAGDIIQAGGPLALVPGLGGQLMRGLQTAQRFLTSPTGVAVGTGAAVAPVVLDQLTGQPKKLRVTRKMQREVKNAVMLFGIDAVAAQMGVGTDVIFYIITKKFRNDGPYVTKAAVRKTRQTVRKLKTMCDMYDDLRPPARRAARRTTSTTRITNVK